MRKSTFSTVLLAGITAAFLISSQTAFAGPNLVGWWKLDEGIGSIAYDSAGDNNGTVHGAVWTTGQIDGALGFDGSDDYVAVGDKESLKLQSFTLTFWSQNNHPEEDLQGGIAKGKVFGGVYEFSYKLDFHLGSARAGVTNTSNNSFHAYAEIGDTNWHMWTMTAGDGILSIYKDGVIQDSAPYTEPIDYTKKFNNFAIGAYTDGKYAFDGIIDDVRIYDRALSAEQVWQLYTGDYGPKAFNPSPFDGATGVDPSVVLSWVPGYKVADANGHDVYFGNDYNDVNDADTTVFDPNNVYMDRYDTSSFDPCGLDIETTYYWRVDEVNEPNLWKGDVWSFTTVKPYIGLSSTTFDFLHLGTNPDDQILTIFNDGIGTLNWQIAYDCDWLTVDPCSGSSTGQDNVVILSIDTSGLDKGTYECELLVVDPCAENSPQTVYVNLYPLCPGDVTATVTGRTISPPPPPFIIEFDIGLWEGPNGTLDSADLQALIYLLEYEGGSVSPVPAAALAGDVTGTVTGRTLSDPPPPIIEGFDINLWEGPNGTLDATDLQALQYLLEDTGGPYTCP